MPGGEPHQISVWFHYIGNLVWVPFGHLFLLSQVIISFKAPRFRTLRRWQIFSAAGGPEAHSRKHTLPSARPPCPFFRALLPPPPTFTGRQNHTPPPPGPPHPPPPTLTTPPTSRLP